MEGEKRRDLWGGGGGWWERGEASCKTSQNVNISQPLT